MQIRVGLVGILVYAALISCTRGAPEPRPDRTLEPSITESSSLPTPDKDNAACTLLTSDERADFVGYSLDDEVPVRPEPGTEECLWVPSLREPARAAIRVVALSTNVWARVVTPQIKVAIQKPTTGRALRTKLKEAVNELARRGDLPTDRVCDVYLLLAESRGSQRIGDEVYYANIGAMPAAHAISCEAGVMTIVGYGEYGVRPSLALNRGVARLAEAASERAAELFDATEGADGQQTDDTGETGAEGQRPDGTDTEESPDAG